VIPSKLFECMGMGIPVLHGVAGESADIVNRTGVGLVFEPGNPTELMASLTRLRNEPELLAQLRKHCIEAAPNYDRTKQAEMMLEMLTQVAV